MNVLSSLRPRSIRGRLLWASGTLIFLVSLFIFIYFPRRLRTQSLEANFENVKDIAEIISYGVGPGLFFDDQKGIEEVFNSAKQNKDLVYIMVRDRSGRSVRAFNRQRARELTNLEWDRNPYVTPDGQVINIMRPVLLGGEEIGKVWLGFSLADLQARIRNTRGAIALVSLFVFGVGIAIALAIGLMITTPLEHLSETVEQIAQGDLSRRSQLTSDDEVGRLSLAFNTMVGKLESAQGELEDLNARLEKRAEDLQKEIGERKLIEQQLKREKERAELANRAKSDFLANMSHELRTPLNAVIGFAQVLGDRYFGELNQKQTEYVKDIQSSGEHLLGLINDILDIAKIEAGKVQLELSPVYIRQILEHCLIMIKEKCARHRISISLQFEDGVDGLEIQVDPRKLKQILYNLLSNAAKFTPEGGAICLSAARHDEKIVIGVKDTGIGIDPAHQGKIFEEFYQVQGGIADKTPGTGLGLALTKRMVEMHGGRIWVESEGKDKGSRFIFELPINQSIRNDCADKIGSRARIEAK